LSSSLGKKIPRPREELGPCKSRPTAFGQRSWEKGMYRGGEIVTTNKAEAKGGRPSEKEKK